MKWPWVSRKRHETLSRISEARGRYVDGLRDELSMRSLKLRAAQTEAAAVRRELLAAHSEIATLRGRPAAEAQPKGGFQDGDIVEVLPDSVPPSTITLKKGQFHRAGPSSFGDYVHIGPGLFTAPFFRLAFRPPAGEVWEPWNGGDCPVEDGPMVQVYIQDGGESCDRHPTGWDWSRRGIGGIIAYRVIPAEAERPASGPEEEVNYGLGTPNAPGSRTTTYCPTCGGWTGTTFATTGDWGPGVPFNPNAGATIPEAEARMANGAIDLAKIKPGDTVLVRCKVLSAGDYLCVETDDGDPREFDVDASAVVGHVSLDDQKAP